MGFGGSIESFSLADVFQNLAMNQQKGVLRVQVPNGPERNVYFDAGQIKNISHGQNRPLFSAEMLIGRGAATPEQLDQALAYQQQHGVGLLHALLTLNLIAKDRADQLASHQVEEEIFELFSWEKGNFEFHPGTPPDGLFIEQIPSGKGLPISHLIMEAARRVDEWERLKHQIPSFREIFAVDSTVRQAADAGTLEMDDLERRVLSAVDGVRDVDDIIVDTALFRFEVLTVLAGFMQSSLVRPATKEELLAASEKLNYTGGEKRKAKVLERVLAQGADNMDIRRALAEALVAAGDSEKAAIHFGVMADQEMKAGQEDSAATLCRRILQIVPNHLPSRERLGTIYTTKGQKREALIQYTELYEAYRANGQLQEARNALSRAMALEPTNLDVRRNLIQILLEENDRAGAARESELLGDQMALQGQSKPAADTYRKAMSLAPPTPQLKKKLQNVLLTDVDRASRRKTVMMTFLGIIAVALVVSGVLYREWDLLMRYNDVESKATKAVTEAKAAFEQKDFSKSLDKYSEALNLVQQSGLTKAWSPILGAQQKAKTLEGQLTEYRETADQKANADKVKNRDAGRKQLEQAGQVFEGGDIYGAAKHIKEVLDNPDVEDETRNKAKALNEKVQNKVKAYEVTLKRIRDRDFKTMDEELATKLSFMELFRGVPEMNPAEIKLPVRFKVDADGVRVLLNNQFQSIANEASENRFEYVPNKVNEFTFLKDGYKEVRIKKNLYGATEEIKMAREPSIVRDLEETLSGEPYYDEKSGSLYIGLASGGLIQLDPKTLETKWAFHLPEGTASNPEIIGPIQPCVVKGKNALVYVTRSATCISVEPGVDRLLGKPYLASDQNITAQASVGQLRLAGNRFYYLVPVGKRLRAINVDTGEMLWSKDGSDELPAQIQSKPLLAQNGSMILVGCANGIVYALDPGTGKKTAEFKTDGAGITNMIMEYNKRLLVGTTDGKLCWFDWGTDKPAAVMELGGAVSARPVIYRDLMHFGTTLEDGYHAIDPDAHKLIYRIGKDKLGGGVTLAPGILTGATLADDRQFVATEHGRIFSLILTDTGVRKELKIDWTFYLQQARVISQPIVVGRRVLFVCNNGKIFGFDN